MVGGCNLRGAAQQAREDLAGAVFIVDLSRKGSFPCRMALLALAFDGERIGCFDHVLVRAAVSQCADALRPLTVLQPVDVNAAEHAATVARAAMDAVLRIEGLPDGVAWSAESAALAVESAALSGADPAGSAERAVTATSAAVAGSKAYATMSENLLALLKVA